MLQEGPVAHAVKKKKLDPTECFLIMLERMQRKTGEWSPDDYLQLINQMQWGIT